MILLIDDEPEYVANYEIALKAKGFEAELITDVDEAIEFIDGKNNEIEAIILDIMMPYGNSFSADETDLGTRTGVSFYHKIRKISPDVPVFILTNVSEETLKQRFEEEKNCYFYSKSKPFVFAESVKNKLNEIK